MASLLLELRSGPLAGLQLLLTPQLGDGRAALPRLTFGQAMTLAGGATVRCADRFRRSEAWADAFAAWRADLPAKLQLLDILRFQVDEISKAALKLGEESDLEEEKRRLNNVEKLSTLSGDALDLLLENLAQAFAAQPGDLALERADARLARVLGDDGVEQLVGDRHLVGA